MKIAGLLKTSTIDFPNCLAAVVFTPGCNYDCSFCHNRDLLTQTEHLEEAVVRAFLKKRAGLLEGVVISGGEPTLQTDLEEFAVFLKELGYTVKLDTNGSRPDVLENLLKKNLLDYVAMDYKAPFDRYSEVCRTDADVTAVREAIGLLRQSGIAWELRTTVIPELSVEDVMRMAREVEELPAYALQLYRPVRVERKRVYTPKEIQQLTETVKPLQPHVFARC